MRRWCVCLVWWVVGGGKRVLAVAVVAVAVAVVAAVAAALDVPVVLVVVVAVRRVRVWGCQWYGLAVCCVCVYGAAVVLC